LNQLLSGGQPPRQSKDSNCLCCAINKLTKTLAKLDGQVGQIAKTYELMFGEDLDWKEITAAAVKEFYPLVSDTNSPKFDPEKVLNRVFPRSAGTTSEGIEFPEDTPQEVKDIASLIKSALESKGGKEIDVKVIDVFGGSSIFGVNPKDHKSFKSFWKAVLDAKKSQVKEQKSSKREEATVHTAKEGTVSDSPAVPTSNGSQSSNTEKDSSKNSSKDSSKTSKDSESK
jgi:hypothetical protein